MINIKVISEKTGVSADTIRYYERIGLIPAVKRNENGVRIFDEEDIRWIQFSRQMRTAGLSIESLIEYISLFKENDDSTIPARIDILTDQYEDLSNHIKNMQIALDRLKFKINNYENHMVPTEKKLRYFDQA